MADGYYQCTVSVGAKGGGASHARYVGRTGEFEHRSKTEKLEAVVEGNLPAWARTADVFFAQADKFEREKGTTYRDVEFALPRELNPEQRLALANDFRERLIGDRHAFIMGLHTPVSQFDGKIQPHAHLAFSERTNDGIARDPGEYFKRYNAKNPEKGGCKKLAGGSKEALEETRKLWEEVANEHLERAGLDIRLDRRSLKERGIERTVSTEKHWGPAFVAKLTPDEKAEIQRKRDLQKEVDQIQLHEKSQEWDLAAELAEVNRRVEISKRPERVLPGRGKLPTMQEMQADLKKMREEAAKKQSAKEATKAAEIPASPLPTLPPLGKFQSIKDIRDAAKKEPEKEAPPQLPDAVNDVLKMREQMDAQIREISPQTPKLTELKVVTEAEHQEILMETGENDRAKAEQDALARQAMEQHQRDNEEPEQGFSPTM